MLRDHELPTIFAEADQEALTAQKLLFRLTAVVLIGAIFAAVFASFSLKAHGRDWAALVSLVLLVCGLVATAALAKWNPNRRWYDLRALAESIKSLTWMWAVGGGDFGVGKVTDEAARADFAGRVRNLREQLGGDMEALRHEPVLITGPMAALRAEDLTVRTDAYLHGRLAEQRRWYTRRAEVHRKSRNVWGGLSGCLQAVALVFALLRFLEIIPLDLVGVATTAAVGAAAWLRGRDHAGIAEAYRQTAFELSEIEATIEEASDESKWAIWVSSAETALSREHTAWAARRRRLV